MPYENQSTCDSPQPASYGDEDFELAPWAKGLFTVIAVILVLAVLG